MEKKNKPDPDGDYLARALKLRNVVPTFRDERTYESLPDLSTLAELRAAVVDLCNEQKRLTALYVELEVRTRDKRRG